MAETVQRDAVDVAADVLVRHLHDNEWRLSQVQGFGYGPDGMLKTVRDCWLDHDQQTIWQNLATPETEGDVNTEMMRVIDAYRMSLALRATGALRSASNSGAEAMREAVLSGIAAVRASLVRRGGPAADALVGILDAQSTDIRALPAPGAPASPWRVKPLVWTPGVHGAPDIAESVFGIWSAWDFNDEHGHYTSPWGYLGIRVDGDVEAAKAAAQADYEARIRSATEPDLPTPPASKDT